MKQQISPPVIVAAIVIIVVLLGVFGWKTIGGSAGGQMDDNTVKAHMAAKKNK